MACKPPRAGEVYKVAINHDQDVLDEVKSCEIVRRAFQGTCKLYAYTPLLPVKIMSVTWIKTGQRGETASGTIHYIPLQKFKMDGYKLLFSVISDNAQFTKALHGVLHVFMRFLDVLHRKGVLHMDVGLQNALFNSPDKASDGVVCDFQGAAKRLNLGKVLYGDAWTSPLLAKYVPREASKHTREMWRESGFEKMFSMWEKHSTASTVVAKVSRIFRQFIDFHCIASSLMRCLLYMYEQPRTEHTSQQQKQMRAVISCLIGDPRKPTVSVCARSVFFKLHKILLPFDQCDSLPRMSPEERCTAS